MKKVVKDTNKEMKHYLGLLNEMHGENLKGIREGFKILNKKFDRHEKVDYDEFQSLVRRVQKKEAKI